MNTTEKASELFGDKINSSLFTWDNYCGTVGISVLEIFNSDYAGIYSMNLTVIGWCNSTSLIVRPKSDGIAVMFHGYGEDFWCHVSEPFLNTLYLKNNLIGQQK